jgi:hypothetical protein
LAQADEAVVGAGQGERGPRRGCVGDGGADGAVRVADVDGCRGAGGVFADVGQSFLDGAVDGALDGGGKVLGQFRLQLRFDAAAVDQSLQVGEGTVRVVAPSMTE